MDITGMRTVFRLSKWMSYLLTLELTTCLEIQLVQSRLARIKHSYERAFNSPIKVTLFDTHTRDPEAASSEPRKLDTPACMFFCSPSSSTLIPDCAGL